MRSRAVTVVACVVTLATNAEAQTPERRRPDSAATETTTTVVAPSAARYRAGAIHRFFLGSNYRELWATPIRLEVLDLRAEAGGLTPKERGGGLQTSSLRLEGADEREYVFRSVDKDPARALPEELRGSVIEDVHQDQVSAFHPAGALVVARLLDATRIKHAKPRLVTLPDDASLGEFRAEFAGRIGIFEERAERGFDESAASPGARRVSGSARLFERMLESSKDRPNTRVFLAARLFDNFVGDRDRHRDQWRWGLFSDAEDARWEPIPRDRDMAFAKYEGLLPSIAMRALPQLVSFGQRYPSMQKLTWNSREIDRRLLVDLEWPVWDSVAGALQTQLTDSVIDDAIGAMPADFVAINGAELRAALMARRDRLRDAAWAFYTLLAGEVDLAGTNEPDLAEVTRTGDGAVEVALSARTPDDSRVARPYLRRRFMPRETNEVRIYLHGGNDRAIVRGSAARGVTVRIIGGEGDDEIVDSLDRGPERTRYYDSAGNDRVIGGDRTVVDRRRYTPPVTKRPQEPPRDWGRDWLGRPWVSYAPDVGLFLGASVTRFRYGFRSDSFASKVTLRAGYALEAGKPRAQLLVERRRPSSDRFATLELRASGIEVIRFYGLGNETTSDQSDAFYRVYQTQYFVEPSLVIPLSRGVSASLGIVGQVTQSETRSGTLLGATRPYGSGDFGEAGARMGLTRDTRDNPVAATRGAYVTVGGTLYPSIWDVERTFGEAHATAATYLSATAPLRATLAVRAAGKRVWGDFPFFESAFLGGSSTMRGWAEQRFAGHTALYGNAELRLFLTSFRLFVPGEMGVFGLADAGRVYASDEESGRWHTGFGGGLWIAPLSPAHTLTLAIARGEEKTGLYFRSGFLF